MSAAATELAYGDLRLRIDLGPGRFATVATKPPAALTDVPAALRTALAAPIDSPPLAACVRPCDRATHLRALHADFSVPGQTALALREHAERAEIHLYSALPPDLVARTGMRPLARVEDFFAAVTRRYADDVTGYVLPEGARYLPVVEGST